MTDVRIPAGPAVLEGNLIIPDNTTALVLFVHGSGSSRHSPRNQFVARQLNNAGLATLLFDGGEDHVVIELNEKARAQMRCEVKINIVPGATHLFEEPGALERVAQLASDWFVNHLGPKRIAGRGD